MRGRCTGHSGILPLMLLVGACSDLPYDDTRWLPSLLPGFAIGSTTREELLLQLGLPVASFENDHILAWRVVREAVDGHSSVRLVSQFVSPWYCDTPYDRDCFVQPEPRLQVMPRRVDSLIVVFDAHGRVARATLLQQR